MMKWSMIVLVGLLGMLGCGGDAATESAKPTKASPEDEAENAPDEGVAEETGETVIPSKAETKTKDIAAKTPRAPKDRGTLRVPGLAGAGDRGAKRPTTRAASRIAPPKGMDAHPDFVGARVGLIHTANVMGEVDPCG